MRQLSLAPATVPALSAPEFISCAALAGYSQVALRLIYGNPMSPQALLNDESLLRATKKRLRDESIGVSEIEVLVLDEDFRLGECSHFLETSAGLDARHLVVCVNDDDLARASDNLANFCQAAASYRLHVNLEFVPYMRINTLDSACKLIHESFSTNAGVLIDAIHFDRAGHCADEIKRVPSHMISYVQLCDATAGRPNEMKEIVRQAREDRLYPGEGSIDLCGILGAMAPDLPISIEVPNLERIRRYGELEHARLARAHLISLLERLAGTVSGSD